MQQWVHSIGRHYAVLAVTLLAGAAMLMPEMALAEEGGWGIDFCGIVTAITSDLARAIATIAIIVVGIGCALGRFAWTQAILVAIGVALIFGANAVLTTLGTAAKITASGC